MLPDPKYVEIFRSGPRAWNAWRDDNSGTIPNLTGIAPKLSERQMGPVNGGPINLKSALMQGAFLRFATLSSADLEAADMSDADLTHARLDRADLTAAKLSNALLDHADFSGATLTKVNLCGASLQFANLSTADLQAAVMSDADLTHARLNRANLSAANLTNARLDYADFSATNLSKVNLCGASLEHAKNLTESQLKESTGSASTILPPHLKGSVPWSTVQSQTEIERHDLRPRARLAADVDVPHISSHNVQRWRVAALFAGLALVITMFLWQRMNEAGPIDTSRAQKWLEPLASQPRLSPNTREQGPDTREQALQPPVPKTLTDGEAIAADPKVPPTPSGSSTVDRTERILGQPPPPEAVPEGVPQETSAHAELPASDGVKRLTETVPNEHVPITLEQGQEAKSSPASGSSALVSIESLAVPSEHAVIPDLPGAAPIPDPQVPLATEQPAEALALNTHSASAPQSMVSDLPAEAAIKERPAEALAVNTPEQHFDASSPKYTTLPPVTTAPPSVDVTELPSDPEIIPRPARKPLIQKPVTKPVIQKPVTKPVIQKPVTKPVIQKPVTKSVNQRTEVDRAKGQSFFDKKVRSSIADLLVGGL